MTLHTVLSNVLVQMFYWLVVHMLLNHDTFNLCFVQGQANELQCRCLSTSLHVHTQGFFLFLCLSHKLVWTWLRSYLDTNQKDNAVGKISSQLGNLGLNLRPGRGLNFAWPSLASPSADRAVKPLIKSPDMLPQGTQKNSKRGRVIPVFW